MLKKFNDFLSCLPMTCIGGILLLFSFILPRNEVYLPFDPAWGTVIICGIPLLYLAIWRIIYNPGISKISSALLITIAMFAAIAIGDLFAAGEVVFIMAIGALLEDATTNRARKGLKKLVTLTPTQGRRICNAKEEILPAEQIKQNDILRILPGEVIPVDGLIISGETSIDQSIMTGESLPVDKVIGDEVYCGTLNCFGAIDIRATKVGANSSLQKLIYLVQEAEKKKAPIARIADKVASWLVPVALLIAIITGVVTQDIVRAVTVLVVFCPCALILATPTAIMAAIGQAAKHGVIIKSGEALEKMGKVDTIAFDKTGTLTYGKLMVCDIQSLTPEFNENKLLYLTASAEIKSEHPLGKAVVAFAKQQGLVLSKSTAFKMTAGQGISAEVEDTKLFCGNEKYLLANGVSLSEATTSLLAKLRSQGKASIIVAINNRCCGILALSDSLKANASLTVQKLADLQTKTVLLTGDNQQTAAYFAKQVGIKEIYANLLPEEKLADIARLQAQGRSVCMVGDGVNDAPALKAANVSVAMGSMGSDIAVEAADIALMSDDISKIAYLKRLSKATVQTIKLSIALSMCINFIAIALSVLGLLTPTTGALVHNFGSCFVVLIAALLYDRKFE